MKVSINANFLTNFENEIRMRHVKISSHLPLVSLTEVQHCRLTQINFNSTASRPPNAVVITIVR
jgi:hypothetical protein